MPKDKERNQTSAAVPSLRHQSDVGLLEAYIQDLWKFLPLPTCYVNPIHKILDANTALLELTGHQNVELIGEGASMLFGDQKEFRKLQKELLQQDSLERELTLQTKGGEQVPVRLYSQLRKDEEGEIMGYFLALIDITKEHAFREELESEVQARTKELEDTRRALLNMLEDTEAARQRAEEDRKRTEAIISHFPDGLMVLGAEGRVEMMNPEAEEMFDVKARDILGKNLKQLKLFPTIQPLVVFIEEEGGTVQRKELGLTEKRILEVSTIVLQREEKDRGTIIALHDISREKEVERLKTEFVSLAAHQLRTPLSAIKWTLRMLLDGDAGELSEEQRGFLEKTYRSNERMITLINDLLNVTRIEEGRYLYKPEFFQIEELLQGVVDSYKGKGKHKDIKLEYKKPKEQLPRLMVDAEKVMLAVQNLIDNAIRYTPSKGTVAVGAKLNEKEQEVEVMVKDTGMGIPERQQGRVFEKFFRATNAKRVDTEGSGLGLYLVKNIVEAHEGRIWFESKEGKGTTFHFTLPVKKELEEFLKKF